MPKTKSTSRMNKRIKERDKVTMSKIVDLADDVTKKAFKGGDIAVAIPTRTKSNTLWNKKRGILQMGDAKASRELFNLNQAKQFMQTCLHGNSIKELIEAEKSLSLRGMFYKALHTIAGAKSEKTFADQDESDCILEDLEVSLGALREELHVYAKKRGTMV